MHSKQMQIMAGWLHSAVKIVHFSPPLSFANCEECVLFRRDQNNLILNMRAVQVKTSAVLLEQ